MFVAIFEALFRTRVENVVRRPKVRTNLDPMNTPYVCIMCGCFNLLGLHFCV